MELFTVTCCSTTGDVVCCTGRSVSPAWSGCCGPFSPLVTGTSAGALLTVFSTARLAAELKIPPKHDILRIARKKESATAGSDPTSRTAAGEST